MQTSTIETRFLIISDTHDMDLHDSTNTFRQPLPEADVLLHCGDLTNNGGYQNYEKALRLLGSINADLKLVIAGNHDLSLDKTFYVNQGGKTDDHVKARALWTGPLAKEMGITFLDEGMHHFTLANHATLSIFASPYSCEYGLSAFQYPTNRDRYNSAHLTPKWAVSEPSATSIIPDFPAVDVIMTHGPPKYILDSCDRDVSAGCPHLRRAICRAKPRLHAFGHIHEAWGGQMLNWEDTKTQNADGDNNLLVLSKEFLGRSQLKKNGYAYKDLSDGRCVHGQSTFAVNAAIMDKDFEATNVPWLVDVDLPCSTTGTMIHGQRASESKWVEDGKVERNEHQSIRLLKRKRQGEEEGDRPITRPPVQYDRHTDTWTKGVRK